MDRLLKLIEEGDPAVILSEEELVPRFNELMKHDLVTLKNERVFLTEKGKEAKREGVEKVINREKSAKLQNMIITPIEKKSAMTFPGNRGMRFGLISLMLLLIFALAFYLILK